MSNQNEENLQNFSRLYTIVENAKKIGDWGEYERLLNQFNISILSDSNESILHHLVQDEVPIEILKLTLDKGFDPNVANSRYGRTPIYYANQLQKHKLLIDYGANVNHKDESGWTAARVTLRNEDVLKLHINSQLDIEMKDMSGQTIFFDTILDRYPNLMQILIESGVNINSVDLNGLSPLFYALMSTQSRMLEILLANNVKKDTITLKDYDIGIANVPLILKEKSTIYDLITLINNWFNTADIEEEWIKEYKDNFEDNVKVFLNLDEIESKNEITSNKIPWYKRFFK